MASSPSPQISIVTPTWNSAATIVRTVESILNQTLTDFEHIVIDNLSSDGTLTIVQDLYAQKGLSSKLKITSEKDSGIASAFNKGVQQAKAPLIAILNSDDAYSSSTVLQTMWDHFIATSPEVLHGDMIFEDELLGKELRKPLNCDVRRAMPHNHPTMFISAKAYDIVGLYDESFRLVMDYEWIMRSQQHHIRYHYVPQVITLMDGRGVSKRLEVTTFTEIKRALQLHGLWNISSRQALIMRYVRYVMKSVLFKVHLHWPLKIWRKIKFS